MTLQIHEQGGWLGSEIELAIRNGDQAVKDDLGGKLVAMETRMGAVETRLTAVEGKTDEAIALGRQSVAQNTDILTRLTRMEGAVEEVTEETAEGVMITKKWSVWSQTAKDMHVNTLARALFRVAWPIALFWAMVRILGPEAAAKMMQVMGMGARK